MSITGFSPAVEKGHHQEVSFSQRIGKNNMQVAFYADSMVDPVLTGVGEISAESGEVLPDMYSGTFSYQGNDFATRGLRVVLQRKLLSDLTATLDYAYGGVLDLSRPDVQLQDAREWIRTERRQAVAAKFSGTIPKSKTRWIASYRLSGTGTLTPVDLFNTSAGQADPYLNLCIRQPIPGQFLRRTHGDSHGPAKSSGAGVCPGDGTGRTHSLSRAVGTFSARRRGLQLLGSASIRELQRKTFVILRALRRSSSLRVPS